MHIKTWLLACLGILVATSKLSLVAGGLLVGASAVAAEGTLEFRSMRLEQQAQPGGGSVNYSFGFRNLGDEHVAVERIEEGCGCLSGRATFESVPPGGEGVIEGHLSTGGLHGTVAKSLWVAFSNGERYELVAVVQIPEALKVEPQTLQWAAGGDNDERAVTIENKEGPPLAITEVMANLPQVQTRLETIAEGRSYRLHLKPQSTDKPLDAVVQIRTSSTDPRDAIRAVFASVAAPPAESPNP